jgi:3-phenylpropionate/trans-cinnamate dioxygenase ferredoxin component
VSDVRVCSVHDLDPGAHQRFNVNGVSVCVIRIGDDWYAINDTCSHEDYSLCEGDVWEDELEIECPKHGSTFSLRDGEPQSLPATKPVPVYSVRVEDDDVIVSVS